MKDQLSVTEKDALGHTCGTSGVEGCRPTVFIKVGENKSVVRCRQQRFILAGQRNGGFNFSGLILQNHIAFHHIKTTADLLDER